MALSTNTLPGWRWTAWCLLVECEHRSRIFKIFYNNSLNTSAFFPPQTEEALAEGEDDPPRLERHPSLTRQITTEYLRLGHLFLGKTDNYLVPPSSPSATGSAAPAAAAAVGRSRSGDEASSEASKQYDGSNGGRPPQQPPPERGAHSNGAAKTEGGEKGGGRERGNPKRGRRVTGGREEEGEEGVEMSVTVKRGALRKQEEGEEEGDVGPSVGSASDGPGRVGPRVERGNSLSPPRPLMSPGRRLRGTGERDRAGGPYRGGVDGWGDRCIGFAGSPRGEQPTLDGRGRSGIGDTVGEELLGNGVEYYVAGGSSENRRRDSGKDAVVEFEAAPQGETWAAEESEAFLEEGLEEMLSGASR